jgi:purine-binding chemotaxis protein CheW
VNTNAAAISTPAEGNTLAGEYMTFRLEGEVYGLAILKVRELIGRMAITRVPGSAGYMRGVINLRGKVIPVMDLRIKLGMSEGEATDHTVIIVVQLATAEGDLTIGVQVDEVLEVLSLNSASIGAPPAVGTGGFDAEVVLGVAQAEERIVFLLDIDQVLADVRHAAGGPTH